METLNTSRRTFIKTMTLAGGGLMLGFHLPISSKFAEASTKEQAINAFIRIAKDGDIAVMVPSSEMGQGIYTALPMIVAEELEADWTKVRPEMAPLGKEFKNPAFYMQSTGGSTSVKAWWQPLSQAGATAREMLIAAAAKKWGVAATECEAKNGMVLHKGSGKKLGYGDLVESASKLQAPKNPAMKPKDQYRLIGKSVKRLDTPAKVDGSAVFGIDVRVPNMLYGSVKTSPVFGGEVASMNEAAAKALKGVKAVVPVPNGVVVVADSYWRAKKGVDALDIQFKDGKHANLSNESISKSFHQALENKGAIAHAGGDVAANLKVAKKTIEVEYEVPFLAHATMEPQNCTAFVTQDSCEIWSPTQGQDPAAFVISQLTGLPPEKIKINTTFLGGGFGRRFEQDFLIHAVLASKAVGQPVKVVWSREEDTQHDFYRPCSVSKFQIGLGTDGMPVAWNNRIVCPSILTRVLPQYVKNGIDPTSVEGANELPYGIPHQHIDYVMKDTGIPVGFWRSVGSSHNAFYVESAIDEAAHASNQDPYQFRRKLLDSQPRFRTVLDMVAKNSGWGKSLPKGHFQGIALAKSFGSIVGEVAEISITPEGQVQVHRVVCVIDCGSVVNPDTVVAQMESGIVFGLTATLNGTITINKGRVIESNFHDYKMMRMAETPKIDVEIVQNTEAPGGVGEPGTPPVAPAITNAIFAATGYRIRKLPVSIHDLKSA